MKKEITLGQLLTVSATILTTVITAWITLNNRVSVQGAEIKELQDKQIKIEYKIDKIYDMQIQILVKLENKSDRPK